MHLYRILVIFVLSVISPVVTYAESEDSICTASRYSVGASAGLSALLGRKDAGVSLVRNHSSQFYSVFVNSQSLPADSNAYDYAWQFPSVEAGVLMADFSHVKLSRDYDADHYLSGMGYEFAAYGSFRRDLFRSSHARLGYALGNGIAYSTRPYNRNTNVDNEFTGSRLSIYFGVDLYASYRFRSGVETGLSLEFRHFSNSALDRPNKGANCLGVSTKVAVPVCNGSENLTSVPSGNVPLCRDGLRQGQYDKGLYLDVNALWGGKALLDEWLYYYYNTPANDPDYQTSHFRIRNVWGLSVAPMWRYSLRYASGIGLDYSYVTYADRIHEVDIMRGVPQYPTNSHVLGISLRHEAFYKQVSAAMSVGYYLYRKMGYVAEVDEKPYYETIGIRWYPSFLHGKAYIGYDVKAHLMKADCLELRLGLRLDLIN